MVVRRRQASHRPRWMSLLNEIEPLARVEDLLTIDDGDPRAMLFQSKNY